MEYTYELGNNYKAAIDNGTLFINFGLRNIEIPLAAISGYYRYKSNNNDILIIVSGVPGAKKKKWHIHLDPVKSQSFFDDLVACTPRSANLLHMKKKQALKILGVSDRAKQTIVALPIIVTVIAAGLFFPELWHSIFDRRLAPVTIETLYQDYPLESGFLSVPVTLNEKPLVVSYRKWFSSDKSLISRDIHKRGYYPIVPKHWKQGDPIKAVLLVDGSYMLGKVAPYHGREKVISGVVRNILWEKFSWTNDMDDLSKKEKSPVVKKPIVIDYGATPSKDLLWTFGGFLLLILPLLGLHVWRLKKESKGE
ncbi:MAG: hypothetical protein CR981_00505 [Proteobacteria bacterium]|nr:MAG: hypothetical protein CR981_00505 [Pseudomonadota bacterium]